MQVTIVDSLPELQALRTDWNRLAEPTLFQQIAWVEAWWLAFQREGQQLVVLLVKHDDEVKAILPLYADNTVKFGRTLAFLGSGKACGDYLDLIADLDCVEAACDALVGSLLGSEENEKVIAWDTMSLEGIRTGESNAEMLAHKLSCFGCGVDHRTIESAWRMTLPNSWESYISGLSKRTRRTIRTLDRDYIRPGHVTMEVIREPNAVSEHMPLLIEMHEARREQLKESGCFSVSGFQPFIEDLLRLLDSQLLEIRLLRYQGKPIAINLGHIVDSCFYIYQCGFVPNYEKHKPGWILNTLTIQEGIAGAFDVIDFLRGDERYKQSLGAVATPLGRLEISAPTSAAMLRRSIRMTGSSLKQWWN